MTAFSQLNMSNNMTEAIGSYIGRLMILALVTFTTTYAIGFAAGLLVDYLFQR